MVLKAEDLKSLHKTAVQAAYKAGEVLVNYDRTKLKVDEKEGASSRASEVVTEVDLLCQETIVQELIPSIKEYDFALLTEETADDQSRFAKDYFWCVDPIDGTLPYIENRPGYSIVISLISQSGEALIGVIYDPLEQVVYSAIKGMGAYKNSVSWSRNPVCANRNTEALAFVFDRSFYTDERYADVVAILKKHSETAGFRGVKEVQYGGAAMNAMWLAQQYKGCYFKFPQKKGGSIWDYAASNCIYNELNLPVSDIYGENMDLNRKESTHINHKGILYATDESLKKTVIKLHKNLNSD